MENLRFALAIILSMAVFLAWQHFFAKPHAPSPPPAAQESVAAPSAVQPAAPQTPAPSLPAPSALAMETPPARPARDITVRTPLYTAVFSEQGAVLTSLALNQYRETIQPGSPPKQILSLTPGEGSLGASLEKGSLGNLEDALFDAGGAQDMVVESSPKSLAMSWQSPLGVVIRKTFEFQPGSYAILVRFSIDNQSAQPIQDRLTLAMKNRMPSDKSSQITFVGPLALASGKLEEIKLTSKKPSQSLDGAVRWFGITWQYFMSAFVFDQDVPGSLRLTLDSRHETVEARLSGPDISVAPGQKYEYSQEAFFGPKDGRILKAAGLGQALHFGFFHIIAKPCLWLMQFIYSYIPNYGVAIILLTLLIKAVFWPLGNKSYRSMEQMKKLQPLMQELREKYKDDKQRMNQEIFALYRTFKVNPMSGCLPMVIQIPVFIALYKMLYIAIELRHAHFIWWITDLSAPDRLFHFPFSVPLMAPPAGIPVLTIIMGASMLIQQKMSPPPGDPMQAKMMMLLPLVFLFIFINFPSGLVLYWLINNLASIAQQYYIRRTSA